MSSFTYQTSPQRVVFRNGALQDLGREVTALGKHRVLVLCTPTQRNLAVRAQGLLGEKCAGIFDGAVMHVPVAQANAATEAANAVQADCVLAIGGGSAIGLAKAVALMTDLPVLAVPTTYSGSEMTPIYGMTEGALKRTGRDVRVLPRLVIYDPEMTLGLPAAISLTSGINAIAHAAEGLYAVNRNPVSEWMSREGIAALARSLPVIAQAPGELDVERHARVRSDALYGSWLCGTVLGSVGMGIHHKLCHTLGGTLNLPHAEVHTVILPHALAYNAAAAPEAMEAIALALGVVSAPRGIFDLADRNGAPTSLRQLGMQIEDVDRVCELALLDQYPNPRPLERGALRLLILNAFDGIRPD